MAYIYTWTTASPVITDLVRDGAQEIREGVKAALNERLLSVFVNLTNDPLQHKTLTTVDNTYDIGSTAARFKAGYINGISVNVSVAAPAGAVLLANNSGYIGARNAANSATLVMLHMNGSNVMQLYNGAAQLTSGGAFIAQGTGSFGLGTASTALTLTLNGAATANFGPYIVFQRNTTDVGYVGTESGINGNANANIELWASTGYGIKIATNSTVALTISTSQGATFAGAVILTGSGGGGVSGSIYKAAIEGLAIWGITGSSYDLTLVSPAGTRIMQVATGTLNITFNGSITGTSATFTGSIISSGGSFASRGAGSGTFSAGPYLLVQDAGGSNSAGWQLNATNGLDGWVASGSRFTTITTSAMTMNVPIQVNGFALKWDQAGTRSWQAIATGGTLSLTSGDANGTFQFNPYIVSNSSVTGTNAGQFIHSHATNPYGIWINFSAAAPNNGTNYFIQGADSGTSVRFAIYSNGGLSNYSANNVNLSDESVKSMGPSVDGKLAAEIMQRANFRLYKYKDQTHGDWNIGLGSHEFYAAVAHTPYADSLVNREDWKADGVTLWGLHETDLNYLQGAALKHALQKIDTLERGLSAALSLLSQRTQ